MVQLDMSSCRVIEVLKGIRLDGSVECRMSNVDDVDRRPPAEGGVNTNLRHPEHGFFTLTPGIKYYFKW